MSRQTTSGRMPKSLFFVVAGVLAAFTGLLHADDSAEQQVASLGAHAAPSVIAADTAPLKADLDALLNTPELTARLSAWDIGIDELHDFIDGLSSQERQRLADSWHRLATDLEANRSIDASIMYLTLVIKLDDAKLFASVISNRI